MGSFPAQGTSLDVLSHSCPCISAQETVPDALLGRGVETFLSVSTLDKTKITKWISSLPMVLELVATPPSGAKKKRGGDLKCLSLFHFSISLSNSSVFDME